MAFAAVNSLIRTIERLIIPTNQETAQSASEELQSLRATLKRLDERYYRSIEMSKINALDAEIREAVYRLEDMLQSADLLNPTPPEEINGVEQEMHSILTTLKRLKSDYNKELDNPPLEKEEDHVVLPAKRKLLERTPGLKIIDYSVSSRPNKLVSNYNEEDVDVSDPKNLTTVGLSDQLELVTNQLLDGRPGIKTISIALVGMTGIGKTHLSLQVYQDPVIVQKFKFRAWVRLGQKDRISNALAAIVAQMQREPISRYIKMSTSQLQEILQRSLHDQRYLIVLDDVWNREVYSALIREFPRNVKEIRILLTTRLEELAKNKSRATSNFLDSEESWNLLRLNVFPSTSLSPQLEKIGRNIAEKCEGLPLLILAVAKILCGHEKTEEYWNMVANNKTTTFPDAYDQISKVLYSSYNDLPQYLKVCFLYMGVFPQRCEIPLRKLVNLWSVEDIFEYQRFLLEGFSMECVKNIVSKSLAIVCNHSSNNFTIKSFRLHSAYWHLCVKEARKNKFFHVIKDLTNTSMNDTIGQRRFSIQNNVLLGMKEVCDSMAATSTVRSLLCTGPDHQYPVPICFDFLLLKVLDALAIRFYDFPNQVLKLLHLRYLGLTHDGELPSSISKLEQLEYLILRKYHYIVKDSTCLPKEIWGMQELRHLQIMGSKLPHPTQGTKLWELSTLYVNADSCIEAVFRSIPNLKKLGIKIEIQPITFETVSCFQHIGLLGDLVSLKCVVVNPTLRCQVVAPPDHLINFPKYLMKLCLNGLGYDWIYMSLISSLPYLKVLKLRCSAFQGPCEQPLSCERVNTAL